MFSCTQNTGTPILRPLIDLSVTMVSDFKTRISSSASCPDADSLDLKIYEPKRQAIYSPPT